MNANAQQMNDLFRTWTQQCSDAALAAVNAHEQFVNQMVQTMNRPMAIEQIPAPARTAMERTSQFVARQTLETEKFVAGLMREGIENAREQANTQPEFGVPVDADKARANTDRMMKQAGDVMKREMAFVNERMGEMAEFNRSMMESGLESMKTNGVTNVAEGDSRKVRVGAKA